MKVHLVKRMSGNRISLNKSECGKNKLSLNNQVLMVVKTNKFKQAFNDFGKDGVCLNCLAKAKEQGRI